MGASDQPRSKPSLNIVHGFAPWATFNLTTLIGFETGNDFFRPSLIHIVAQSSERSIETGQESLGDGGAIPDRQRKGH